MTFFPSLSSIVASPATRNISLYSFIRPPPQLMDLPSLSFSFSGSANVRLAPPLNTRSSPGQEPERSSKFHSASGSANWGPKPTHQPVGTHPSGLPSLNFAPAASFGAALVPSFLKIHSAPPPNWPTSRSRTPSPSQSVT